MLIDQLLNDRIQFSLVDLKSDFFPSVQFYIFMSK